MARAAGERQEGVPLASQLEFPTPAVSCRGGESLGDRGGLACQRVREQGKAEVGHAHWPHPLSPGRLALSLLCCPAAGAADLGPSSDLAQGGPRGNRRTLQSFTVRSLGRTESGGQLLKWARWPPPDSPNSPAWPEPRREPCSAQGGLRGAGGWAQGLSLQGRWASRRGLLSRPGLRAPPLRPGPPLPTASRCPRSKGARRGSEEEPNIVP